jgi:O-acetylserine/cysteine efflux transporter
MNSNRSRTFAALVSAGLLWGTTVPLSKLALHWMAPGWLTFVRFAVAAAILLPATRHQLRAALRPAVLISGALGYGGSVVVQNAGITRTSVTHAALLIGTVPVLVAIIAAVWHRTVARPVAWAGFALSLAGVGLVTGGRGGGASAAGDALVLASLLMSAMFTVGQTRLLAGRDPVATTAVQFLGAALAALPFAALTETVPAVPATPWPLLATAVLAVGGTLLPFALFAYAQSRVPAEVAGAFLNIEPLVGAGAGAVFFGNPAGPGQLAGGAAILGGIVLSSLPLLAGARAGARAGAGAEEAAGGPAAGPGSGRDPVPAADEVPAGQLVHLAPGLEPLRPDPEVGVAGQLARVEPGLGGERVAHLGADLAGRGFRLHGPLDQHQVAGRPDAEPGRAGGPQVAAGRAGGRGGDQHRGAVPQERQRYQVGAAGRRIGGGHPRVHLVAEPAQCVRLALPRRPGGRVRHGSLRSPRSAPGAGHLPGGHVEAVEHVGRRDHENQGREAPLIVVLGGLGPDLAGHRVRPVAEPGHRLGEGERGPLGAGEVRRLTPRGDAEQPLVGLTRGLRAA